MMTVSPHTRYFEENRARLVAVAYRMLGSMSDAEDVVQDAWLRFRRTPIADVHSPASYLTTIVSRLCIDRNRRLRMEKLVYPGPWLPEPIPAPGPGDPEWQNDIADSVSQGFLMLLEKLSPLERAVLILREVFDFSHEEIAGTLDIRAAHSRQLLRRARSRLRDADPARARAQPESAKELLQAFATAINDGDTMPLEAVLAENAIAWSDGGGKVSAALIPLQGNRLITVLRHLISQLPDELRYSVERVNGDWGMVARMPSGDVHSVTTLELMDGRIQRMFIVRNPAKLTRFV